MICEEECLLFASRIAGRRKVAVPRFGTWRGVRLSSEKSSAEFGWS